MKKIILLASASIFCQGAFADNVSEAETRVKESERTNGALSKRYADDLFSLACTYQRCGRREDAEKTYEKALSILKSEQKPDSDLLPSRMMTWAGVLSLSPGALGKAKNEAEKKKLENAEKLEHDKDLLKAEKIMEEAISILKKRKGVNAAKYHAFLQRIGFYSSLGRKAEKQAAEAELDSVLKEDESYSKNLTQSQIYNLASTLDKLAAFESGYFNRHYPAKPAELTDQSYKKSENFKQRAVAVYDKLPEKNPIRLEAHRTMVKWYEYCGKVKEAQKQQDKLAKLLGSTDPALLFPAPAPCPACGRG